MSRMIKIAAHFQEVAETTSRTEKRDNHDATYWACPACNHPTRSGLCAACYKLAADACAAAGNRPSAKV